MSRNISLYITILFVLLSTVPLAGQQVHLSSKEIDQKFSEVWKTTQALRKSYRWKEKTEVIRDGEPVSLLIEEVSYGSDGRLKRRVLQEKQAELPSSLLIRQIAEAAKAKIVRFMLDLSVFLNKYSLSDDDARHAFFDKAAISFSDKHGLVLISGTNVLTRGDRVQWWINTRTYALTRATISTIFEGSRVEFNALYVNSPPGMNYFNKAEIQVPDKKIIVKLEFFDFTKP